MVTVAADQSFLSFVYSPVLASIGSASDNRKYISTDHFAAKVMRSVVSVRFFLLYLKPADLELDVLFVYGSSPQLTQD